MILASVDLQTPDAFRKVMEDVRPKLTPYFDPVSLAKIDLAMTECLINAWEHGNRMDPNKTVSVRFSLTTKRLLVRITDEGAGFTPALHDGTCPDADQEAGSGLYLMKEIMDDVKWNRRGNDCLLIRKRPFLNPTSEKNGQEPTITA